MIFASYLPQILRKKTSVADERRWLDFYAGLAEARDVNTVFAAPGETEVEERKPSRLTFTPKDIPAVEICYQSPFEPLNKDIAERYLGYKNNRTARALHWRHPDGPRPTLILVHGVVESWYSFNAQFFSLKSFYDHGYDAVSYTHLTLPTIYSV